MLTGDALLTSLHVAKQVGICSGESDSTTSSGTSGASSGNSGASSSNLRLPLTLVGVEAWVMCPLAVYLPSKDTTTTTAGTVTTHMVLWILCHAQLARPNSTNNSTSSQYTLTILLTMIFQAPLLAPIGPYVPPTVLITHCHYTHPTHL